MGRSQPLRVLLALGGALALLVAVAIRPAGAGVVQEVDSVTITVSDIDRALAFYEDVLSFEKVSDVEVAGGPTISSWPAPACGCGSRRCGSAPSSSS